MITPILVWVSAFLFSGSQASAAERKPSRPPPLVGAANSKDVSLGLLLGIGVPSSSDKTGGSRMMAGVDAFTWISKRTELGGTYTTGAANSRRISLLGLEMQYHFAVATPGIYVGAAFGITSLEPDNAFFPSFDDFYFGPKLGYDYFLTPEFSLGAELKFLYVMSGPSYMWLQTLGGMRFHF
jgi:hypothetical protein